ncbi:alcohol dehydrogenase catalytic domain-containing protein [uncultured Rubinisphaera sp.]|uniref:alcohol dehydrogenase catalytic domain-containing protein n=1 Tax=uncultured Rubinisphaera sp. TaxID=1678686 RepID=UPI0030DC4466|tara:strand:+ start:2136 stop:3146 length:1011 start_codon:yes stop_codon:yes gene_type:complete
MKAMILETLQELTPDSEPLKFVDWPDPEPQPDEVVLRVAACGVCHTELDEIEGRLIPPSLPLILGHEVIGYVESVGDKVNQHRIGNRVGVGWIYSSTGDSDENLDPTFQGTGCDHHGGYAEKMSVPARYAYPIPELFEDAEAAPLMCAGSIGYRALKLTQCKDGDPIGLTGFGGSAHLVLSLIHHLYPRSPVSVFARDAESRQFALDLGASWAGPIEATAPVPLKAIIDTTPAWKPVVNGLRNLQPGGRLVINAIRKEARDQEELLMLNYHEHLWMERQIQSVANITHYDISEFLKIASEIPIRPTIKTFPLQEANQALRDLKFSPTRGANVLVMS